MIKLSKDHPDGPTTPPLTPLSPVHTSVHMHALTDDSEPLITQCQVSGIQLELTVIIVREPTLCTMIFYYEDELPTPNEQRTDVDQLILPQLATVESSYPIQQVAS